MHIVSGIKVTPGPGAYDSDAVHQGISSKEATPMEKSFGDLNAWRPLKTWAPGPPQRRLNVDAIKRSSRYANLYGYDLYNSPYWNGHVQRSHPGPANVAIKEGNTGGKNMMARSAQSWSLGGRTSYPVYNSSLSAPPPGSYNPQLPKGTRSGVSMGTRHSKHMVMLLTPNDII